MPFTIEIEIDQPRARVVELFDNPENLAFWQPGFISYTPQTGDRDQPGSTALLRYRHETGQEFDMIETVHSRNLPDEFTAVFEIPKMMKTVMRYTFEEIGSNRTRLTSYNIVKPTGFIMKMAMLFAPGSARTESEKFMRHFKAFVETGADVRKTG